MVMHQLPEVELHPKVPHLPLRFMCMAGSGLRVVPIPLIFCCIPLFEFGVLFIFFNYNSMNFEWTGATGGPLSLTWHKVLLNWLSRPSSIDIELFIWSASDIIACTRFQRNQKSDFVSGTAQGFLFFFLFLIFGCRLVYQFQFYR